MMYGMVTIGIINGIYRRYIFNMDFLRHFMNPNDSHTILSGFFSGNCAVRKGTADNPIFAHIHIQAEIIIIAAECTATGIDISSGKFIESVRNMNDILPKKSTGNMNAAEIVHTITETERLLRKKRRFIVMCNRGVRFFPFVPSLISLKRYADA
jgi:hypothetical protein